MWPDNRSALAALFVVAALSFVSPCLAQSRSALIRAYDVNRKVADFAVDPGFASPEAAYASIHRQWVAGTLNWRAVSAKATAGRVPAGKAPKPVPEIARQALDAEILEVRIFQDKHAAVFARMAGNNPIDIRYFDREGDRWLNVANDRVADLDRARQLFAETCIRYMDKPRPPAIDDPERHLQTFVDCLKANGREPKDLVLDAVARHRLVAIGEIHHRPTYWALNTQIIRDPRFARHAGVIYLELPSHGQPLVDRFLAAEELDAAPVIEMLRDMMEFGWPDQPIVNFFVAVWNVNRSLPPAQRLRIVLVDMPRPWKEIQQRGDLDRYDCDRDELMARNILADLSSEAAGRHGLFIVGYMHLPRRVHLLGDPQTPLKTAGWYLHRELGDELCTFLQHGPVIANVGPVSGRVAGGLFDEAFGQLGHRPVAFLLAGSPFGAQRFDASADLGPACVDRYEDAFDGYIYLEQLEKERFSALAPNFYTDEFVRELDRRYRLMYGRGVVEVMGLPRLDGASVAARLRRTWGQPRDWNDALGPLDAWRTPALP